MERTDTPTQKDLLRFSVIGSVDDGKSTLIGRLLYDSKCILDDQVQALQASSKRRGENGLNLALLTDGLKAEREQGVTIDVAYKYFSTSKRKFIVADCPGHIQYTRNMVTGTSSAEAAIILVDAQKGLLEQTRRHSFICSMMGIQHLIVCINKMDLVDFSQEVFCQIRDLTESFLSKMNLRKVSFLPISALHGDGVVQQSKNLDWFDGPSLLELLENLEIREKYALHRFPVQKVIRSAHFRGYAGRIESGEFSVGDEIILLPSSLRSKIKSIHLGDRSVNLASAPLSVVMTIDGDFDLSRGDMIVKDQAPAVTQDIEALICWLSDKEFQANSSLILKHTTRESRIKFRDIIYKVDINSLEKNEIDKSIKMNDILKVRLRSATPLFVDSYLSEPSTGSFILIDAATQATVASGILSNLSPKDDLVP